MKSRFFWIVISLLIVGVLVLAVNYFSKDKLSPDWKSGLFTTSENKSENTENIPLAEGQTVTESFGEKEFKHSILGFSFSYLKDYSISSFGNYYDSVGQTILLQKNGGGGLQILITPFDEDISLTIARIKKDLPNLVVQNAKEENKMVIFESTNNLSTGKSLEAWFVYRKNLYQISASLESKDLFQGIINSWRWQ